MWSVVEDSRPLRNHNAFVRVHDKNRSEDRWVLVDLYRHATNHWYVLDDVWGEVLESPTRTFSPSIEFPGA